ncbi:hypothetical protein TTHERM_00933140 (macronuclear) [Tetrahymena thermophila SB210]|uniref:Uncharacterized protein n=1 Tax=Tetrahymena thermophila (strain SB210) TaxID=312017 RepID=I7LWF6_TETTS|nr:hypothetical protein TTHERM_00933140 [Tetrahymena thermophila SB210]EAS01625.3 hypothetical protein TTHERM_00933140 [Tetrahymena thermophila SB210]|eukprot:XP_001021870.3 hypothetical protein TTHERM_00933140 [Tetrahymena thermophila SB210]
MAEFASNDQSNQNPKRRLTAMEIKKQQKQRKSLGFSLANTNIISSQQTNKEDEQDELIKEKTIFNESSGKTVKEILGKGENSSNDIIRQNVGQMSGENSNSMKMFNSQFNNFYQEFYQNNTTIYELQKKQSSQQIQKKDQKQYIIDQKGNYQLINEVSLISAVNFDWFKDIFSSTQQLSGYDTSKLSKESLQLIKQQIRNLLSTYKYEKAQSILSGFNSQFNKEKSIMKNQEVYLTMRDCYQNFLQNKQHFYYYINAQFIILFIHVQNEDSGVSHHKADKDRIVAVVWAKTLKSFDKYLENSGIEFTDISELQRKQQEVFLLQEKKKRLQQENLEYFQDILEGDKNLNQDLRIAEMEENYNQAFLNNQNQKQNKLMQDENNEDTQSNMPFSTLIDNQSTVLLIKKKYVQSLWNCLINQNLETDQDSHSSFQKMEIISNFAFEHSQKCNLKEYFNGQIISSDVQQYSYLLDEMEENQFIQKSQCNNLEQIFQIDNSNKLYNLKLKGEIPFPQIKELVGLLNKLNINFAIFYQENPQTKYFKGDIIKFDN